MLAIPALSRLMQKDLGFEASLGYIVNYSQPGIHGKLLPEINT
jgi:hypothetical protein